jgi:hypothetical protein
MSRPGVLRLSAGMVGGGAGADIGKTHRYAMRLDDRYTLDSGVFAQAPGPAAEWRHEDAHHLIVKRLGGEATVLAQGMASLSEDANRLTRVGLGHPEGFIEAFANFYRDLADEVRARRDGGPSTIRELSFPTGRDGLIGVQFVEAVAASHHRDGAWVVPGEARQQEAEN